MQPGRTCPLDYGYSPAALAAAREINADCIYVIGGLYGNAAALDVILELAAREASPPTLVFNGDFNWFNVDAAGFQAINSAVLDHLALRGNVETELARDNEGAGCGCGYPDFVDDADVERSNSIMATLRATARQFPDMRAKLAALPMFARAVVGNARIAIVHGDCESLAGWGLSREALSEDQHRFLVERWFEEAKVEVIASSHSCLPVLAEFPAAGRRRVVINNGAAGMPNFSDTRYGLLTRIGLARSPIPSLYGARIGDAVVEALPVNYDYARWQHEFDANWPAGSAAHASYARRIAHGPQYSLADACKPSASAARRPVPA